jgi:hypothetical protein
MLLFSTTYNPPAFYCFATSIFFASLFTSPFSSSIVHFFGQKMGHFLIIVQGKGISLQKRKQGYTRKNGNGDNGGVVAINRS